MAGRINRIPVGLLGFLGLKSAVDYPSELSNVLAPTFDLLELYAIQNVTYAQASGTIATGTIQFGPGAFSQPRGPILVLNFGVQADCSAAGSQAVVTIGIGQTATSLFVPCADSVVVNNRNGSTGIARPLWIGENETVAVNFRDVTLVPTYVASIRYAQFSPG